MASEFSNYYKSWIIDKMLRNQAFTVPTAIYLALYTVAPTAAGGGTEVSGGAYTRQVVALDAASNGVTANTSEIAFTTSTAAWGTIVAFSIFDADTEGNLLMWGAITVEKVMTSGDTFKVAAGDLDLTVS